LRAFFLLPALFSLTFPGNILPSIAVAHPVSSTLLQEKTELACSFLKNLYNPSLGLVRSTPSSTIYFIANDNILAERALLACDPTISQAINQSISSCCDSGYDGMHEALLGIEIPLPIHNPTIFTIANSTDGKLFRNVTSATAGGNYTVLWEVHNATGTFPDCTYADVTTYTALELKRRGNITGAEHQMECLNTMFDGHGMVDEAYKAGSESEHGIYQTFKLALHIYALQKVSCSLSYREEEILFRMQGPDGGFHTGYDQAGTYAGTQENTETTSIAIIAISSLSTTSPFAFPFFSIPMWIIYLYTGLAGAAVAGVITVLVLEQRKREKIL